MSQAICKIWYGLLLATGLLNAYSAHADQFNPTICVSPGNSDPRLLEVEYLGEALVPCRTYYTKWDLREQIGSAEYAPGHCEGIVDLVVENLAHEGFLCRKLDHDEKGQSVYERYKQVEPDL